MIHGWQELIWAIAALAIAVLIAYGLVLMVPHEATGEVVMPSSVYNHRLDAIDREAVENAYRDQVHHLFIGWMKDATGQPARAINGQRQARRAYIEIITEIDKRKAP